VALHSSIAEINKNEVTVKAAATNIKELRADCRYQLGAQVDTGQQGSQRQVGA